MTYVSKNNITYLIWQIHISKVIQKYNSNPDNNKL